ncbi:hypothetical protein ACFW81_23665 [Streptomyces angustmyceticus]|uniref:hypothetical protein n=1 Tax=Streptomyces angustmyceticus TaxID=285578 RepID=UPI0036D11300
MPSTTPAPPDHTTTYAARTDDGRLVIARLGPNPASPLQRALRAACLIPDPDLTKPLQGTTHTHK